MAEHRREFISSISIYSQSGDLQCIIIAVPSWEAEPGEVKHETVHTLQTPDGSRCQCLSNRQSLIVKDRFSSRIAVRRTHEKTRDKARPAYSLTTKHCSSLQQPLSMTVELKALNPDTLHENRKTSIKHVDMDHLVPDGLKVFMRAPGCSGCQS
jgi:hypothetical protein